MATALEGIRVLDVSSGFAGALATMVLCDNGADVIKIEPPQGDPQRSMPAFLMWNRGKKSVVLDLKRAKDQSTARRLAEQADIFVQSWRPGVAERLGLGYADFSKAAPGLIYCSITGFGPRGSYAGRKGYEHVVDAVVGRMAYGGKTGRDRPYFYATPWASFGASQTALHGILAALYVRERTGRGQKVETSLVQGIMAFDFWDFMVEYLADKYPDAFQTGPTMSDDGVPMSHAFYEQVAAPTRDGRWLYFSNLAPHLWRAFIAALDLQSVLEDPDLQKAPSVAAKEKWRRLWELILTRISERSYEEWIEVLFKNENVGVELIRTTSEAMEHPQMLLNGHVVELNDPRVGVTKQLGPLVTLTGTPAVIRGPAPDLGRHSREVLASLRASGAGTETARRSLPKHPLDGVTVLELGYYYAAPFGASILADLGARVVKVEPLEGDPLRAFPPLPSVATTKTLQGKESVALDLRSLEGQEIVRQLIARSDLVMCGFRPDVAGRLGVGYEQAQAVKPDVFYLYATSYGREGPYARRPAFAVSVAAAAGDVRHQLGLGNMPDASQRLTLEEIKQVGSKISQTGVAFDDGTAALVVATGLLLGLVARQRTGIGQAATTTMLCSIAYSISDDFITYDGRPAPKEPDSELYGLHSLYRLYECQDGWVFLACCQEEEWKNLCEALDRPDLWERFKIGRGPQKDMQLGEELARLFSKRAAREWENTLAQADVACVEVNAEKMSRVLIHHRLVTDNGFIAQVDHPTYGPFPRHGLTVDLSLTPGIARGPAALGQHTRSVLQGLGYSAEAIQDLLEKRIVAC